MQVQDSYNCRVLLTLLHYLPHPPIFHSNQRFFQPLVQGNLMFQETFFITLIQSWTTLSAILLISNIIINGI